MDGNYRHLIAQMTLEEKAALCSGADNWHLKSIPRLGVPSIAVADGPHGVRKVIGSDNTLGLKPSYPATCFPTASAMAATWNRELVGQVGRALAEECLEYGISVLLAPGINIKRSPLCGRNFEYFSEDPYLSGELGIAYVDGLQSMGVGASLKHYAANNQEYRRLTIDAIIDERALREIYLTGFEMVVKRAKPWTVMAAYNKVNGEYCGEHHHLLQRVLRQEWGFDGVVVSDWGAVNDRVEALKDGLDLEMPGVPNGNTELIIRAVRRGVLDEEVLDRAVERLLHLIERSSEHARPGFVYDRDAHHQLARQVAEEGIVLLKNERVLPLSREVKVGLIGAFAKEPRYQGAGSSLVHPTRLENLYDEMVAIAGVQNVLYAPGYDRHHDEINQALIDEAVSLCHQVDVVVVCAGLTEHYETEGLDRQHLHLPPAHNALIQRLAEQHSKVVVVLSNGAPVEMPWINQVAAVVEGYLGGQAGASAMAAVLYGMVNPSGKLAETFPLKLEHTPCYQCFPGGPITVEYRESVYVGYRYYDSANQPVLFPFGHGLSYTTFEYSDMRFNQHLLGKNDELIVQVKVTNTGRMAGKEVLQLYVRDVSSSIFRPLKELKGFEKVFLKPGETQKVEFRLPQRAFAYYDVDFRDWVVESGTYEILVGASSRDIRCRGIVEVQGLKRQPSSYLRKSLQPYYLHGSEQVFDKRMFEALYGKPLPSNELPQKGQFNINTPIVDMTNTVLGRLLYNYVQKQVERIVGEMEEAPNALMIEASAKESPMRVLLMSSGGEVSREIMLALLMLLNGKYLRGLLELVNVLRAMGRKARKKKVSGDAH